MAGTQKGIRWDDWIPPAVEAFGRDNGTGDFSKTVKFLVRTALIRYGYLEETYKPALKAKWKEPDGALKKQGNTSKKTTTG